MSVGSIHLLVPRWRVDFHTTTSDRSHCAKKGGRVWKEDNLLGLDGTRFAFCIKYRLGPVADAYRTGYVALFVLAYASGYEKYANCMVL
jgi:hypothetical protein